MPRKISGGYHPADFKSGFSVEGDVAYEDTETDRHEEHRFKVFLDGEPNEEKTHGKHDKVLPCRVVETGEVPELSQVGNHEITKCLVHIL